MITKIAVSLIVTISLAIIYTRQAVIEFYTDDEEVQDICMTVFLVVAINFLFDGLQAYFQGPIRAMGLQ